MIIFYHFSRSVMMRFSALIILLAFLFSSCAKNDSPSPSPDPVAPTPVTADTLTAGWQLKKIDSAGKGLVDITFIDANTGFACGETGTILKTVNGGSDWLPTNVAASSVYCSNIRFINSRYGFVASNSGVFRTTDGGSNWVLTFGGQTTDIFFLTSSTGYSTSGSGFRKSVDSGKTWTTASTPFGACSSLWFTDTAKGFVTANASGLYKTVNSGASFSQVFSNTPGAGYSPIYFANTVNGCAAFGTSLYITNDGGTNWSVLKQFPNSIIDVKNVNASEYYVSTQTEIWHTTDGGSSWIREVKLTGGKIAIEFTLGQPGHVWIGCSNGYVCYK